MNAPLSKAQQNRMAFPQTARMLDDFRRVFGEDTKLRYASEGGKEIGRPITDAVPLVMTPKGWNKARA